MKFSTFHVPLMYYVHLMYIPLFVLDEHVKIQYFFQLNNPLDLKISVLFKPPKISLLIFKSFSKNISGLW